MPQLPWQSDDFATLRVHLALDTPGVVPWWADHCTRLADCAGCG
jgi:hypothetical protein